MTRALVRLIRCSLWLLFWLYFAACQPSAAPPPRPSPSAEPLEQARDYELGRGVARNYAAAAELYRQRCDGGAGDLIACRRLVNAIIQARGVDRDLKAVFQLADAMCRRDDLLACVLETMAHRDAPGLEAKLERLTAVPCDAQHRARCEIDRDPFSGFSQSGSVDERNRAYNDNGCRLGVLEACARLRYSQGAEHDAAVRTLTTACAQGDATACEALDRPLPARVRCEAHDFGACLALGCTGDAAAAAVALAHHAGECPSQPAAEVSTRITPSSRLPLDSLEFRPVGTPVTGYQVYNASTQPITLANIEIYGYDVAGTPVDQQHVELRQVLEPGAGTLVVVRNSGTSFELCVSDVMFDDGKPHTARCPRRKPRHVRWGDGHDNLGLTMHFPDIPLAPGDHTESAFAAPYELAHPGVLIRERDNGLLHLVAESTEPAWIDSWRTERGPQLELPLVIEPTTIVYRLDEVPELQLSADTLAGVLSGQITQWNDRAIAKDNPGRALPALAIKVLQPYAPNDEVRVTRYLATRAPPTRQRGARAPAPQLNRPPPSGPRPPRPPGTAARAGRSSCFPAPGGSTTAISNRCARRTARSRTSAQGSRASTSCKSHGSRARATRWSRRPRARSRPAAIRSRRCACCICPKATRTRRPRMPCAGMRAGCSTTD